MSRVVLGRRSPSSTGRATSPELLAARARAGPRRRGARRRLRLERRLAGDRARGAAPRCSRSRRTSSATGARATSPPSAPRGELICFLTQDATPLPGWLDAYEEAFALARRRRRRVRPAPAAAGHVGDDRARADRVLRRLLARRRPRASSAPSDPMFLSNVNACYRRACWEQIRFADVPLRRGPGVRARDGRARLAARVPPAARRSCTPTTTRRSASCAATSTSTAGCTRRAGTSSGSACARRVRDVRGLVARRPALDARAGLAGARRSWRATGRSAAAPHARASSRRGARLARAPAARAGAAGDLARGPRRRAAARRRPEAARAAAAAGRAASTRTVARRRARGRRRRSLDPVPGHGRRRAAAHRGRDPALPARQRRPLDDLQPAHAARGARAHGLDLALRPDRAATRRVAGGDPRQPARVLPPDQRARSSRASTSGTAPTSCSPPAGTRSTPVQRLPNCRARAYLVQDHEPEFFATSAESVFAERTYAQGLYCIAASPWLRDLVARPLRRRTARAFELGVDHDVYHPRRGRAPARHGHLLRARRHAAARRPARRCSRSQELQRRRPDLRFVLFGDEQPRRRRRSRTSDLGVASPERARRGPTRRRRSGSRCR